MPETQLAAFAFHPDGGTVFTPPLPNPKTSERRIIVEGVIRYGRTGESFDAVYGTDERGAFSRPHSYLRWTPRSPILEAQDTARHRYTFRILEGDFGSEQSVGLQWDIDRFVERYLVPPSEVRSDLSGSFALTVTETPIVTPFPWRLVGLIGAPGALLAGGLGIVLRRRIALSGLTPDLQAVLGRIEMKLQAVRRAIRTGDNRGTALAERLGMVKSATIALVWQMANLRRAQAQTDAPTLESEIVALEQRLPRLSDPRAHAEAETTLKQKRRTLTLLRGMAQTESRCELRLAKLEALLDNTLVSLQSAHASTHAAPSEDGLVRALDAEVTALHEVASEMAQAEPFAPTIALNAHHP